MTFADRIVVLKDGQSPGVQHAGQAHFRAHALGIGGDGRDRFGGCLERSRVDRPQH